MHIIFCFVVNEMGCIKTSWAEMPLFSHHMFIKCLSRSQWAVRKSAVPHHRAWPDWEFVLKMVRDASNLGHLSQPQFPQHVQEQLFGPTVADWSPTGGSGATPTQEARPQLKQDWLGVAEWPNKCHALSRRVAPQQQLTKGINCNMVTTMQIPL